MRRRFSIIAFLLLLSSLPELRAQASGEFILMARRTPAVEVLDALTLQTVAQLHFDFNVEKLSASRDGAVLYVDGYSSGPCCRHFSLNLSTLLLKEISAMPGANQSPDGHWRFELKSFREPALRTVDLSTGARIDLAPPPLCRSPKKHAAAIGKRKERGWAISSPSTFHARIIPDCADLKNVRRPRR